jgi:hypothetical protein
MLILLRNVPKTQTNKQTMCYSIIYCNFISGIIDRGPDQRGGRLALAMIPTKIGIPKTITKPHAYMWSNKFTHVIL